VTKHIANLLFAVLFLIQGMNASFNCVRVFRQMCDMDIANVMTPMTAATPVYRPPTYVSGLSPRCNGVMSFDDVASTAAAAAAAAVIGAGSRGGNGYSIPVSMAMLQGSGAVGERRERVLLRPWLENLINSGSVPGLEWIDEIKTTFKVPWKHRSKKNWSLLHSCVFLVRAQFCTIDI
jgi:Interferon regulatory factor transcription factor